VTLLSTTHPKSRKQHRCHGCSGVIQKGEVYQRDTFAYDGEVYSLCYCPTCYPKIEELLKDPDIHRTAYDYELFEGWITEHEAQRINEL